MSKEKLPLPLIPRHTAAITSTGGEGQHDGLVFSVALALWAASEGQSIGPASGEIAAMFKWW